METQKETCTPVPESAHTVLLIEPTSGWSLFDLKELWRFRELLFFLVWRDVKVRYKQTVLGAAWAILQPVVAAALFTVVFGHFARVPSEGTPYAVFVYAGLLPWQLFAYALTESTNSIVLHQEMIKKIYFPRLYLPLAPVVSGLVDFVLAFVVLLGMLVAFRVVPGTAMVALPAFVLLAVLTAFAVGVWLAALNVRYRDVRYAVPFLVQVWFFATPIVYGSSLVPARWRALVGLNPMAGVVEGFRWTILGKTGPSLVVIATSAVVVLFLLVGGLFFFRRIESTMADLV